MTHQQKEELYNVFVYGSLLEGLHNHRVLKGAKKLDGTFTTKLRYRMISLGSYPAVQKVEKSIVTDLKSNTPSALVRSRSKYCPVKGEMYQVNKEILTRLDALEGNGRFYNREEIEITSPSGSNKAWIYFLMDTKTDGRGEVSLDEERNYSWVTELQKRTLKAY